MKCSNRLYQSYERPDFSDVLSELDGFPSIYIQVFSGLTEKKSLQQFLDHLIISFPSAVITGASTAGEIWQGKIHDNSVTVSFCGFRNTSLHPIRLNECSRESGQRIADSLKQNQGIKAAVFFAESMNGRPEDFVHGITEIHPGLIAAGGAAGDGNRFQETFVILGNEIFTEGVTGVAFENPRLIITTDARLGYTPLGNPMTVTKAEGNRLIEIDGRPVRKVLEHYLGSQAMNNLPAGIVHFPFLIERGKQQVARAPVAAPEDGSLIYAGNFLEGDRIRFGIIDTGNILDESVAARENIKNNPAEAVWIYSCMGRRSMLGDALNTELSLYSFGIPVCGFLTYGEFYHNENTTEMLNLTTTVFALSESESAGTLPAESANLTPVISPISTMSHLINTISRDLAKVNTFLEGYRLATDHSSIVSMTDEKGVITYVNESFCRISGFSKEDLIGRTHRVVKHPETPDALHRKMWETITNGRIWKGIYKNRSKSGEDHYLDTTIVPFKNEDGRISQYICVRHDLTRIIHQERTIEKQYIDVLTGLPNRIRFFRDLEEFRFPAVGLFNVDRFQDINNYYGFEAGDFLLREISRRIRDWAEQDYRVYRSERDEFIIAADTEEPEYFFSSLRLLSESMNNTVFSIGDHSVMFRSAIGAAKGKNQILSRAESALKTARKKREGFRISSESEERKQLENFRRIGMIRRAVEEDQVVPFFQPIQRTQDGVITAYEALIRIRDSDGRIHSPAEFLDLSKHSRYYPSLQASLIRKALSVFRNRHQIVSLNLSAEDIQNHDMVRFLMSEIGRFPSPGRLAFEITESEAIEDFSQVEKFTAQLRNHGVRTAIDDFGSGYSNFSYLTRLSVDYLKIDGSIISEIYTNANAYHTLEIIIELARRLNMKTVAEYVSDAGIARYAKEAGVDYFQGYHIGLPAEFPAE